MRKRIIATLMALCMALSLLPVQVLATEGAAQKTESAEQTTGVASGGAEGAYANGADAKIALLQGTEQAYQLFVKMPTGKYHHTEWRQLQRHHFQREDSDREGDEHPRRTDAAHL